MSLLIIERGHEVGKRLPLLQFPVTIGRDPSNAFAIDDAEISRFHLRIKKRGRLFIVEDLDSRNGTFLNGDRILNSILKNGDKLLIGETELLFLTSESDIHIAPEILDLDMVVADELGLKSPIDLNHTERDRDYIPIRLNQSYISNQLVDNAKAIRDIYDVHSNILVIDDLEESARTLLKSINTLLPHCSRSALFCWAAPMRKLIPIATRQLKPQRNAFLLSQRSMEDVITRKQGVLLQVDSPHKDSSGRNRLILPMTNNEELICIIHLEIDDPREEVSPKELELLQALFARCAPSFDAMLLRRELDAWMIGMVETMIATIEAKDTYTHGHSERVSRYSIAIADEMKLNREIRRLLLISALCHDIGKIGIPDAILKKASMLSTEEYEEMKLHPSLGSDIMRHMPNAHRFISGVRHHHEKWDGSGYPDRLCGEEIPFFGRIVAVADVFDAMVSGRAYSGFMDQSDAIHRLEDEKELFDPEILKACFKAYNRGTLTLKTSTAGNKDLSATQELSKTKTKIEKKSSNQESRNENQDHIDENAKKNPSSRRVRKSKKS